MKLMTVALAATMALAAPSLAQARENREPVKLQLSTQGLDFSNPRSVAAFYSNAHRQIVDICNPAGRIEAGNRTDRQCRTEMAASLTRMMNNLAMAPTANAPSRN